LGPQWFWCLTNEACGLRTPIGSSASLASFRHDLAKLGSHRESTAKKKEIAERHALQVVRGKNPLPDLRIEYETREGELARVNPEVVTEYYRGRNLAEKVRAGFSIYAHAQDAAGHRRVLDQRELTAEILSL
jgi:hypothetical protein